ncbi:response regulator [Nanoarchaeota archaeon]
MEEKKKIVIADDNAACRRVLVRLLEKEYEVEQHISGETVYNRVTGEDGKGSLSGIDALILDNNMPPGPTGVEIACEAREKYPNLPIVIQSSGLNYFEEDIITKNNISYISKPFNIYSFLEHVNEEVKKARNGKK